MVATGAGKPKDFRLEYWLIVCRFETITDPELEAEVDGTARHTFNGGVPITKLPWFRPFRERMANFSLGRSPLPSLPVAEPAFTPDRPSGCLISL